MITLNSIQTFSPNIGRASSLLASQVWLEYAICF